MNGAWSFAFGFQELSNDFVGAFSILALAFGTLHHFTHEEAEQTFLFPLRYASTLSG